MKNEFLRIFEAVVRSLRGCSNADEGAEGLSQYSNLSYDKSPPALERPERFLRDLFQVRFGKLVLSARFLKFF